MKINILKYGGYGVDVKLRTKCDPGPDTVYWSVGSNSYVVVEGLAAIPGTVPVTPGPWVTQDGKRVHLASINGIGEIRWEVDAWDAKRDEHVAALAHFGLVPASQGGVLS